MELVGVNITDRLAVVETKVDAIHEDLHAIWRALERLTSRPPIWANMLITILASACTGLAAAFISR